MAIDRSKFTRTSVSQMTQADKDLNKSLGRKEKGSANGHELDEGSNLLRIYPVHPDVAAKNPLATFVQAFVQTFLPMMVQEKNDKGELVTERGQPKMRETVKPVYNAIIHGGKPKDLVDEYIKLATSWAKEHFKDDTERKSFLEPVYGNYGKKINGITYPAKWVIYADKYPGANPDATPVFDRFFFKKSIKDRLNVIATMEAKNEPLGTDPFTDIEEGRAISIFVNPDGGATGYYTTELDSTTTNEILPGGRKVKVQKNWPLTDAQLETFLAAKPLQELYGNCAGRKNFELQLAGLEFFDAKHKLGIFGLPEWDQIVIELDGYYPEEDAAATAEEAEEAEDVDQQDDASNDEFDLMNRQELTKFAKDNKTGILAKPSLSDDEFRTKLREWQAAQIQLPNDPLPGEEGYVEKEEAQQQEASQESGEDTFLADMNAPVEKQVATNAGVTATNGTDAKARLAALRNKAAGAKA